jgi:hypothetical protein
MVRMNVLTGGQLGHRALLALFLALEADFFVLTTGSNWSRLLDELRLNVVNPSKRLAGGGACRIGSSSRGNSSSSGSGEELCTYMLDLMQSRNGDF